MPYRTSLRNGGTSAYLLAYNAGINGQILFRGSADFERFMVMIKKLIRSTDSVDLVGFTLLQDSFYLLLHEKQRGAATKVIQRLSIAYGIYFNTKYDKSGKVFRGPYKDVLLDSDDKFIQTLCKMHRLPELQQEDAETYKWSSYHYYLSRRAAWLDKSFVEKYFATSSYQKELRHMASTVQVNRSW